jgi:hypothetical protein
LCNDLIPHAERDFDHWYHHHVRNLASVAGQNNFSNQKGRLSMIELLIAGAAVAGIGLWRALSRNERNYEARHRGQSQQPQSQPRRAPGAICTPGRDGLYTGCYAPGEYQREQRERGIGRDAAAGIRAILENERSQGIGQFTVQIDELMGSDQQTINQRIAEMTAGQGEYTGDWGKISGRDQQEQAALSDPNTVDGEWVENWPTYQNQNTGRRR